MATVFSFFLGIFTAQKVVRANTRVKAIADGILTLPMVLPPTVAGFFLLLIFSLRRPFGAYLYDTFQIKVVQTWLGCVLAATVIAFPLMYRNARAAFEQVDQNLIYAARTLGMSETAIFWKVLMPAAGPGIVSGTILTFARALGEYGATSMLAGNIPGRTSTISQKIAMVIQDSDYATAGFWAAVIMMIAFVVIYAMNVVTAKWTQQSRNREIEIKTMALQVKITKKLANFTLDVDFSVEQEIFALLGASGCGKSMTLKCIAGIEQPDEGVIVLNGRTLFDSARKINLPPQKRQIGYMFQDYALFPNMTVLQNVMAGMGKRPSREQAQAYLRQFHIEELEQQYPARLSGGQKQRAAMARMLAARPEVILLDEPFSALDSHLKWTMEQQMRQLLQEVHKPTLLVSHNRDEVYRLCNVVSCVNRGKMEVIEPVKEFFRNPKTKAAAALSGCKNIADVELAYEEGQAVLQAAQWDYKFAFTSFPTQMSENKMSWDEVGAIGIRAHYLEPIYQGQQVQMAENDNMLELAEYQVIEDSFEWIVLFRVSDKGDWIQWKTPKIQEQELEIPCRFRIRQENLLFLRKE